MFQVAAAYASPLLWLSFAGRAVTDAAVDAKNVDVRCIDGCAASSSADEHN